MLPKSVVPWLSLGRRDFALRRKDKEVFGAPRNDAHYDDGSAAVMKTVPMMLVQGSTLTRSGNFEHAVNRKQTHAE
jgi:hypothetical protein